MHFTFKAEQHIGNLKKKILGSSSYVVVLSGNRDTPVEPRYFFFTVPVPLTASRSRYYQGTATPQIPRYCCVVLANK